ncbi:hypothetical protein [Winogradskyella ouciana]|uniref:Uncharacterized protein n=1 Tax=Winogradskyella ouciana TaxID=2608631 RepID=A0A7K1GBZ8_9FLAO|nr:hypothetical protein [Winogradskyella ouciana]MTE25924.1 hypothetical protein [Winogradskyella ouciana]
MKTQVKIFSLVVISCLVFNCSNDDDNSPDQEAWEVEVNQIKTATSAYADINVATNEGRFDASGYVPNMGHHYINPAIIDTTFDLLNPEVILYLPDGNGGMEMVAIEYAVLPEDPENHGSPPEGFTGSEDEWHFNEELGQWQLHVWTVLENPDGIFAMFNPAIGD